MRFSRIAKLGILLAIASVIPWLLLLVLPFLPFPDGTGDWGSGISSDGRGDVLGGGSVGRA